MIAEPLTLEGQHISLEPLSFDRYDQLCEASADEAIWRWTASHAETPDQMRAYIETALRWQTEGTALPFAIIEKSSKRAIGSTRIAEIDRTNRNAEVGYSWINPLWQRTFVNTEAKYLLLRHAFETLRCIRVWLRTDALNERSRNAILRLGAKEEGILRNHMITRTGRIRDTVMFSIIDSEWETVKANLEEKLSRSYQCLR